MTGPLKIVFSGHVEDKLKLLAVRGFPVSRDQVIDCMEKPDRIDPGYKGRRVAQKRIDDEHVLRVIYEDLGETRKVVTAYPGRRSRYENQL